MTTVLSTLAATWFDKLSYLILCCVIFTTCFFSSNILILLLPYNIFSILEIFTIPFHLFPFFKGKIVLSSMMYFLTLILALLSLQLYEKDGSMTLKKQHWFKYSLISLILMILGFLGVQHGAYFFDLTQQSYYRLSPTTKHMLKQLKIPVKMTFFVDDRLSYEFLLVKGILNAYAAESHYVEVQYINPFTHPEEAIKYNVFKTGTLFFEFGMVSQELDMRSFL